MKIYKYLPFESGKLTIENNKVLLNNPKNYNDPFDCVVKPSKEDEAYCYKMILNYVVFKEYSSKILENKIRVPFSFLVKFELRLFKKIIKKDPYINRIPIIYGLIQSFLKKFENNNPEFKKELTIKEKLFSKEINSSINKVMESLLLSCFSLENDSILMWSHYADKHKGMCIEFNVNDNNFYKVKYKNKRKKFDLKRITAIALGYDYIGEKISNDNKIMMKKLSNILLTKSKVWKYEKEIRTVHSVNELEEDKITYFENKYFLKMPQITKVFIGIKTNRLDVDNLRNKYPNIEFVYLSESDKKYKLLER